MEKKQKHWYDLTGKERESLSGKWLESNWYKAIFEEIDTKKARISLFGGLALMIAWVTFMIIYIGWDADYGILPYIMLCPPAILGLLLTTRGNAALIQRDKNIEKEYGKWLREKHNIEK